MDWRLLGTGLATGLLVADLPDFGSGYTQNPSAFISSWNTVASAMQYALAASLVLIICGIFWRGSIGRLSAWILTISSFGVGSWMFLIMAFFPMSTSYLAEDCCRQVSFVVVPVENLLAVGLLIPTIVFASSLVWLFLGW